MDLVYRWQFKTDNKRRKTDLINTVAGAKAIDNIKDMVDVPSNQFTLEYDHSLLRYRPMTEADYGYLFCWAENSAGSQATPCRFEIVQESQPDPPSGCHAPNVTWDGLEIACVPGFDGGHLPAFHAEIYRYGVLVDNLTNAEVPRFAISGLEAGADFRLMIYASNLMGSSEAVGLNVTTLNLAEKRTAETRSKLSPIMDDPKDLMSSDLATSSEVVDPGLALLPIVAILCGVAIGLGTVALGVILIVRGRGGDEEGNR